MISLIFPTYNEQDNLQVLYDRLVNVSKEMSAFEFEFIYVDDCSSDDTPSILKKLRKSDDRVHFIRFAKNFGSHAAIEAGLAKCSGDVAVVLAADLQDPPEIVIKLVKQWEKGYKIVWGVRRKRKGEKSITLIFSRIYYIVMNTLSDIKRPLAGADVVLLDRCVIEAFKKSSEKNTSIFMLIAWLGFSQTSITYIKEPRHAGTSKWTFSKKLKQLFDSIISFSYIPLRFMSMIGAISSIFGLLYGFYTFINALQGNPIKGWSSLMIVVLLLGGIQMIMMGLLGEYLWRTYDETRARPKFVIEKNTLVDKELNCPQKEKSKD
jgi:dolichol-phosphate mannosyltransferase